MSLKKSFKDFNIQTLIQKQERLESAFKESSEHITDIRLDNYNLIRKRIRELKQ